MIIEAPFKFYFAKLEHRWNPDIGACRDQNGLKFFSCGWCLRGTEPHLCPTENLDVNLFGQDTAYNR